ncbi:MAG: hypothetical protein RL698_840 [Pseudomonadota bacterium]|jgi:uncharacterized OsmC-like protein
MGTIEGHSRPEFKQIDAAALEILSKKGKATDNVVGTVKCRTVAEGHFRHLNFIRDLEACVVDEPRGALGDDTAPNPVEVVLAALGSCLAVGIQANAVSRGWTVRAIEIDLEGDIITSGVWGTGNLSPKPLGLHAIRVRTHVEIDGASPAELDELVAHSANWSPVVNTVRNPVPVEVKRV